MNLPSSVPEDLLHKSGQSDALLQRLAHSAQPTLTHYLRLAMQHLRFIALLTVLGGLLAALISSLMTPMYSASATVLIEQGKSKVVSIDELSISGGANREYFQTQAETLKLRDVSARAVSDLRLDIHPEFDPRQSKPSKFEKQLQSILPFIDFATDKSAEKATALSDDAVRHAVISKVQRTLRITPIRQSQLVQIGFDSTDPALASAIANSIADAFIKTDLDARFKQQQTAMTWLSERMDQLRKNLETSEQDLAAFRMKSGLVISATSQGGTSRQLDTSADRLVQARIELTQLEEVVGQIRNNPEKKYDIPAVVSNVFVAQARQAEEIAARKAADIEARLGPAHPARTAAVDELKSAQEATRRQADAVLASLQKQYEVARRTVQSLNSNMRDVKTDIQDINRKELDGIKLEREVAINRQLYETFLTRMKEATALTDFRTPVARVVDPAFPAFRPSRPQTALYLGIGLLLGALLGTLLSLYYEVRRAVVRTTDDVEVKLRVPLLATAPLVKKSLAARLPIAAIENVSGEFAESIRTAMTAIQLATLREKNIAIAVTSSVAGEGKSTVAINLAMELARSKRVLLIDADLRRPAIVAKLGLLPNLPGLSDLLVTNEVGRELMARVQACLQGAGAGHSLAVMSSGHPHANALDMLLSERFKEVLATIRTMFDVVVIDSSPVELVSDVLPIAREATGAVYVVRSNSTPIPLARNGLAKLSNSSVHIFGVLLNAHDFRRAYRYYGESAAGGQDGYGYEYRSFKSS